MATRETLIVLTLAVVVAAVFAAGAVVVGQWAWWAWQGRQESASAAGMAARIAIVALAAVALACLAYARFVEPWRLEQTHVRVATPKLPVGAGPVRIVHLSDLHCDAKQRLEGRLPEVVRDLRPDAIVFTGDAVNSPGGVTVFRRLMRQLAPIAPTFAVEGNWESRDHCPPGLYEGTGVRLLKGEAFPLAAPDRRVWIAGGAAGTWPRVAAALAATPAEAVRVVLYHYPDAAYDAAGAGADVLLAGHSHGGQIAFPLIGPPITLSRYGQRFARGLKRVGGTWVYVSRGIGMEGGGTPRMRFFSRPEVALIEIAPEGA